jgi:hypothetical protein
MNFFRLIADFMRALLEFPMRFISSLKAWRSQRMMLQHTAHQAGKEVTEAAGIKGFFKRLGKIFLIVLAIVLLGLFFWLLFYLNDYFDLPRVLGGPLPWLRPFWLPLLVVLFVGTFYLAIRLWGLLGPEKDTNAFPELTAAWMEVEGALIQAGIRLREAPLFFVLGKPNGAVDALFSGSKITWLVSQAPRRVDAPFQVYAHRQAIFVAVCDNSVLGLVLEQLAKNAPADMPLPKAQTSVFEDMPAPVAAPAAPAIIEAKPADPLASPNFLADEEEAPRKRIETYDRGERILTLEERIAKQSQPRWKPMPVEAIDLARRKFNSLVRIIARYRRPFCAGNGVLVLVPNDGLANQTDAGQIAAAIEEDLHVLAKAGQTRCPAWLLVTDLHTVPGFGALFGSLDQERRQRLLGRDFPFQPDLGAGALDEMVATGVDTFMASLSQLTQRLFQLETLQIPAANAIATNGKLFELVEHVQQRQAGLDLVVRRIVREQGPAGLYFGGFYLAATGVDPSADQAFVPGVFRVMLDHQSKVTWTEEALEEESDYQRWATFGYVAMAGFCGLLIALGYWRWYGVG